MDKILKFLLLLLSNIITAFILLLNINLFFDLLIKLSSGKSIFYLYFIGFLWIIFLPTVIFSLSRLFKLITNYDIKKDPMRFLKLLFIYFIFSIPVFVSVAINAYQLNLFQYTPENVSFFLLITFLTLITIRFTCYPHSDSQFNPIIKLRIDDFYFSFIMANIAISLFVFCYYLYTKPIIIENALFTLFLTINSNKLNFLEIFFYYCIEIFLVSILTEYALIRFRPYLRLIIPMIWIFLYFVVVIFVGMALLL